MKLNKAGKSNVIGAMTDLTSAVIIIAIMSFVVILFIVAFAPMVQTQAESAQTDATSRNATAVASLWGIFATDGVFEILAVAVYILIVVIVMISLLRNASK